MEITKRNLIKGLVAAPAIATVGLALSGASKAFAQSAAPMTAGQVPGFYRYRVGEIEVTALLDGYLALPADFVLGYDETAARASTEKSYRRFTPGMVNIPVNGYVINTGTNLILLDAGAPSFISPTLAGLTGNLIAAGFNPADIDTVLLTHFHPDHVGALLNAEGGKTFPNATLICAEAEWNFVHDDEIRAASPEDAQASFDMLRQYVAPYGDNKEMFTGEKELFTGITSLPLPGHTPGHTGYAIHSGSESLLIWGDVIHFSTLQFANPDWGVVFDVDPAMAAQTRRAMFDRASADRMAVAGMHIDFPGIGYVEKSGTTFRHVNAPWMPA